MFFILALQFNSLFDVVLHNATDISIMAADESYQSVKDLISLFHPKFDNTFWLRLYNHRHYNRVLYHLIP